MTTSYNLSDFMASYGGDWRNAVFVDCTACQNPCSNHELGHLLAADRDGCPHLVPVYHYEGICHQVIPTDQCLHRITKIAFERIFRLYLLWELDDPSQCPLRVLSGRTDMKFTEQKKGDESHETNPC